MDDQLGHLTRFERPPIVETAIGVQFSPIANFTAGHYGWFWKRYLNESWTRAKDVVRVVNQVEKFDGQGAWQQLPAPIIFQGSAHPERILILNDRDDRVVQLQNDRFFYNWRKGDGDYPSFATIYPEFQDCLRSFETFLRDCGLELPIYSQWEVSYFNAVPRGELWNSPADWPAIFPAVFGQFDRETIGLVCESLSGSLKFEIPPKRGRVYVAGNHAKLESGEEVLQINLTARGPVNSTDDDWNLNAGMNLGHDILVRTFRSITSNSARSHWGEMSP